MSQRAMSIDNISFLSPPISKPLQYDYDKESDENESKDLIEYSDNNDGNTEYEDSAIRYNDDDNEEENNNIIPWKKLLRKTNSRLSLIS